MFLWSFLWMLRFLPSQCCLSCFTFQCGNVSSLFSYISSSAMLAFYYSAWSEFWTVEGSTGCTGDYCAPLPLYGAKADDPLALWWLSYMLFTSFFALNWHHIIRHCLNHLICQLWQERDSTDTLRLFIQHHTSFVPNFTILHEHMVDSAHCCVLHLLHLPGSVCAASQQEGSVVKHMVVFCALQKCKTTYTCGYMHFLNSQKWFTIRAWDIQLLENRMVVWILIVCISL